MGNGNGRTRRTAMLTLAAAVTTNAQPQFPDDQERKHPFSGKEEKDPKLPNGKSQKDEIAKQDFQQSLKDADQLVEAAQTLRDDLKKSGSFVVSVASLHRTEDIERLARKIRNRLKA